MPGFRSGTFRSLIKKKYGIALKLRKLIKSFSKELTDYLQNKLLCWISYLIQKLIGPDENYVFE